MTPREKLKATRWRMLIREEEDEEFVAWPSVGETEGLRGYQVMQVWINNNLFNPYRNME